MHYVLSDIHGNKDGFDAVLSLINLLPEDHLYILGDVIDRGEHGIELLQQIRTIPNCTLLLGNHEYMMIDCLRNPEDDDKMLLWLDNSCDETLQHLKGFSSEEMEALLCYLEKLPAQETIVVNGKTYILVHATPAELYDPEDTYYDNCKEFMVWHRLKMTSQIPEGKIVVFGHTPTWHLRDSLLSAPFIYHGSQMIGIDCGCGFPRRGGQLGCIRLEDMTEYYSKDGIIEAAAADS